MFDQLWTERRTAQFAASTAAAVAMIVTAGCAGASSGGSSASSGSRPPAATAADISEVRAAARSDFTTINTRDFAQPRAWLKRALKVTAEPLRTRLIVQATDPQAPTSGHTSATVTHTALVSLSATSAYVIVVGRQKASSKQLGFTGAVDPLVGLSRIDGRWLISQDSASGVPGIEQSFTTGAQQAAMRAASELFPAVLQLGTYQFASKFVKAAAGLTGAVKQRFVASRQALLAQRRADKVAARVAEIQAVGLDEGSGNTVKVVVTWMAQDQLEAGGARPGFGGADELTMRRANGRWLIGGRRSLG